MNIGTKKIEFPDTCPKNCPQINKPFYQGNLCHRCPIFNCRKHYTGFCLIEPDQYRDDWAEQFKNWFDNDFKGYPECEY